MKRLLGDLRRADEAYRLIGENARVAVGVSGGKDSLALLHLLNAYRGFAGKRFTLCAATVLTDQNADFTGIRAACAALHIPLFTAAIDLKDTLAAQKSPCSLCARVRRGTLLRLARENGCDTLALGHHADDAVNTLVMSALNEGRLHTFQPKMLAENGVTVIRPMILSREKDIARFVRRAGIAVCALPCPYAGRTERQEIANLLARLETLRPGAEQQLNNLLVRDYYAPDEGEHQ